MKKTKGIWSLWIVLCMLASLCTMMPVTAEAGKVTITAPYAGSYLEKGEEIILTATAEEVVSFFADDVFIGEATQEAGVWSYAWTPSYYGEITITAKAGTAETSQTVKVLKSAEQSGVWALTGSNLDGVPAYTVGDGRTPTYAMSGSRAVDTYSNGEPKITMVKGGVYALEMDVYTTADGDGVTVAASSVPNGMTNAMNLVTMVGADLLQTKNGTVLAENVIPKSGWCTLKLIVDMSGDDNTYDVYIDGRQCAKDVEFTKSDYTVIGRLKLELVNQTTGVNFIDNLRLSTLSESTGEYQFASTPADGTLLEAGKKVMLTAQVKNENDDIQTCSQADFYVNDVYVGSGEKMADGSYGCSWMPETPGDAILRIDVTANGKQFSEEKDLTVLHAYFKKEVTTRNTVTPNQGFIVVNSSGEDASTSNAKETSVAVKLTGFKETTTETGATPYVQQLSGGTTGDTTGIVVSEFDFRVDNTAQGIRVYNRPTDSSSLTDIGVRFAGGKVYCGTAGGTTVDTGYTYEANQTHNVRIVWNLDAGTKDLYFNGIQVQSGEPIRFSAAKNIWQIRYELADTLKASGSAILQNETLRYLAKAPELVSAAVRDGSGNSLKESDRNFEMIGSIAVTYSQTLQETTVNEDNVKLYRGTGRTAAVTDVAVSLEDGDTICVIPGTGALLPSAEYELVIGNGVMSTLGIAASESSFAFRTVGNGSGIYNGSFAISDTTVTFTADAIHTVAEKGYLVVTLTNENGEDKRMKAMSVTAFDFKAGKEVKLTGVLKMESVLAKGDVLRAFVWDQRSMPFGDAFELK
ncbi:MAG: hypothetical protein U0L92_05510 [Clostridia bacterium]|nr:hypothetical protein [Clostridia bacterium]